MKRKTFKDRPPASAAGRVASVLLLAVAAFQMALSVGAPWGEAALGGANTGVLPDTLRVSSAIAGSIYLVLAGVSGTRWTGLTLRRNVLYGATGLMVIGAVMNLASPSFVERMLWTPVTIALVVTLWRAARHDSLASVSRQPVGPASRPTQGAAPGARLRLARAWPSRSSRVEAPDPHRKK